MLEDKEYQGSWPRAPYHSVRVDPDRIQNLEIKPVSEAIPP
jgi:hypothetical protein